jgi:poly(beta-D-mannuronate) lyase
MVACSHQTDPSPALAWPAQLLDLNDWKLTLPIDTNLAGTPDEILQPELATFSLDPYFHLNARSNGVVFRAHCGGVTTSGSAYPRSELREMTNTGQDLAAWSTTSGKHTMVVRQAILHTPVVKPDVTVAQIHDATDHPFAIELEDGKRLSIVAGGNTVAVVDPNYALGTPYDLSITASAGRVVVLYNGVQKIDYDFASTGCYFKVGCYTLSNTAQGDAPDAYGEVVVYDLAVSHE